MLERIFGKSRERGGRAGWIWRVVWGIEFVAIVAGLGTLAFDLWVQRPKDRMLVRSQYLNQITFLALEGQPELASPAIHNILAMMHSEKLAMPNLVIPGLKLHMGHFANVNWQGLVVKEGEFGCDDKGREVIKNWKDGDERIGLCTVMR
ncbi:MAG: hypothetical protein F4Z55_18500, partial [Boseongicola sp. SB0667_bin_21]|nr:hypothetical protein [Boseongicola sp. SB0667_bin_21]